MGPGRKLLCKHVFHASCIDSLYKPQCPLCEHPIFNSDEEALLMCTSQEAAIAILKNLHERNINVKNIFTFLTIDQRATERYRWIVDLMYKYCDFTELLADNLNDKTLVKEIVARGKINWFKTFCGGLTFFDLVYERTNDPEIIALVHDKLPIDPQSKPVVIHPSNTHPISFTSFITEPALEYILPPPPSPPVPLRTYQRHRRMDSMSGAAMEHQLWGAVTGHRPEITSLKPNTEHTATIRRSLRGSRSLYPSLMTQNEEPVRERQSQYRSDHQTYPIYEMLYHMVPSAPPNELM
jgi:hypothetical protein